jgi:hypothetical protein
MRPHWEARFEGGTLHVSGSATKYPNDFSTATLVRRPDDPAQPDVLIYEVTFHRDKEPFCGPDLVGPVHYFESAVPAGKRRVRVIASEGTFEFSLPEAAA